MPRLFFEFAPNMSSRENPLLPGRDVAALLHQGAKREPEAVGDAEVVGGLRLGLAGPVGFVRRDTGVLDRVPLLGAEPTDKEQHHANTCRSGSQKQSKNLRGSKLQAVGMLFKNMPQHRP